jgi:uncharacterized protein (TIGR03437 family)
MIVLFALLGGPCAADDANKPEVAKTIQQATEDRGDHAPRRAAGGTELGQLRGGGATEPAEGRCVSAPDGKLRTARQAVASVAHPVEVGALAQPQLYMMVRTKPATCDASAPPTAVTVFSTTDSQAYLWFVVTNVSVGDVFASSYYTPSGQPYGGPSGAWSPASSAGSFCYTDNPLQIAGATPATVPGIWTVKVTLNGQPLFTLRFTIQQGSGGGTPAQVQSYMMTRALPATCSLSAPPAAVSVFSTTDTSADLWFYVTGTSVGDVFSDEYYMPSGQLYSGAGGPWDPLTSPGNHCMTDNWFFIAAAAPATMPGVWTVKVTVNGQPLFTLTFTIGSQCTYSISGGASSVSASGASLTLNVAAGSGCAWTASSNASWITIQSGVSGTGNGTVTLSISANTSGSSRSGTLTIGGQTVTITQAAGVTPPQVQLYMMTLAVPATCSLSAPPTASSVFAPTDPQAYLWFYATNDSVGDIFSSEYYTPSGQFYAGPSGSWPAVSTAGNKCYADTPFQIAGAAPATMPGVWTVKVRLNGQLVFTLTFTISQPTLPAISAITGGGGSVPPVKEISPGAYVMISGANFAPAGTARQVQPGDVVNGMLPTQLTGVCVDVNDQSAYIAYVAPDRIYFQVPNTTIQSNASIRVRTSCGAPNELRSAVKTAWYQAASPEFLYWVQNGDGTGPVAAVNAVTGALVGLPSLVPGISFSPAKPGDILTIYGVSFGTTSPSYLPGQVPNAQGTVVGNPAVSLGTVNLNASDIVYAGVSPGTAGLYQLNIRVPANLADGTYPLTLSLGIYTTPSTGYITVKNN